MRDNLGFILLARAWVEVDWVRYAVDHPYVSEINEMKLANQFLELDPVLLDDPVLLLRTLRRAREQEYLADLFDILLDARDHRDKEAVKKIKDYQAYRISLDAGRLLRDRGEFERAALYLEAAAQIKPNDYTTLRQLIFLYKSQKRYCEMLQAAEIGVRKYGHEFYLYRAQAYEGLQAWQLAIQDYQRATELADNERNRKGIEANIAVVRQRLASSPSSKDQVSLCKP